MKKSLLIFGVTALVFAGCSNEVLVDNSINEVKDNTIGFSVFANKATKVNTNNKNTLNFFYKEFKVSGWKYTDAWKPVFDNVVNEYFTADTQGHFVYTTAPAKPSDEWASAANLATTPAWYYQDVRYWDKFATKYQFGAFAPKDALVTVANDPSANDCKITFASDASRYTVETTNLMATPSTELAYTGFTTDLMTAVSHVTSASTGVALTFNHELAKFDIKLVLNNQVKTNQNVVVNEITFNNIKSKSYYDSSKESAAGFLSGWATPTDEYNYSVKGVGTATTGYQLNNDIDAGTDGDQNYDGYYVFESLMIPQTIQKATNASQLDAYTDGEANIYVKYTIGTEEFVGYYALANMFIPSTSTDNSFNLAGGNEYILTITVGPAPIYFVPTVTPWVENEAGVEI